MRTTVQEGKRVGEKVRPYASPGNVLDVLARYRQRNLPEAFDLTAMRTAGVPDGMIGRTLSALRFLGLLNEANEPTAEWRALADVDDNGFPQLLGSLVRAAYSDVFALIDPASDTQDRVRSAFQQFQPKSQIDRMVTLFLALCQEAGIPTRDAPKRRPTRAQQDEESKGRVRSAPVYRGSTEAARKPASPPPLKPFTPVSGESKTISLRGGGTLTLHASASFFQLPREDREFVFRLLDQLGEYENQRLLSAPSEAPNPVEQATV